MTNLTSFLLLSSCVLLSIWALYFLIKKWANFHVFFFGKILKVLYVFLLLLVVLISLIGAYTSFKQYWEDDRVRVITEFQGIRLGWSKDEVYFRKGEPISVVNTEDKEQILVYGATYIGMHNNKVIRVGFACNVDGYSDSNIKVGGIPCYGSVDKVVGHYGDSKELSMSDDKLQRIYNYPQYNLSFTLSKSLVSDLMIFDQNVAPKGYSFMPIKKTESSEELNQKESKNSAPINDSPDSIKPDESTFDLSTAKPVSGVESNVNKLNPLDHCAPNLKKAERLRRLALKGTVRETGYQTYSTGSFEIVFSGNDVISCQ